MNSFLSAESQQNRQLLLIEQYVANQFNNVEAGHDLSHIERVYKNAIAINKKEKADSFLVEAAVLLHDIADEKLFIKEDAEAKLDLFFQEIQLNKTVANEIIDIIENVSFGNSIDKNIILSKEQKVVRDADRLDAIGAVGIARAFQYGGHKNRALIDIENPPQKYLSKEDYRNNNGSTINHFYEKLLLLKDKMETETGKELAQQRHDFMLSYLKQFYSEINFEGFSSLEGIK